MIIIIIIIKNDNNNHNNNDMSDKKSKNQKITITLVERTIASLVQHGALVDQDVNSLSSIVAGCVVQWRQLILKRFIFKILYYRNNWAEAFNRCVFNDKYADTASLLGV